MKYFTISGGVLLHAIQREGGSTGYQIACPSLMTPSKGGLRWFKGGDSRG